jgi:hypothetical protein
MKLVRAPYNFINKLRNLINYIDGAKNNNNLPALFHRNLLSHENFFASQLILPFVCC